MALDDTTVETLADDLYEALESGVPTDPLTDRQEIDVADAYRVQSAFIERRLDEEGPVVGHKIGLTSDGIQDQLGVTEPDFGRLLEGMFVEGQSVPSERLIQPRVEPEIGFVLGEALEPPVSRFDVLRATDYLTPVVEVIDSRIRDWDIEIEDTIADNASSACFLVGDQLHDVADRSLSTEGVTLHKNGRLATSGVGANVLDHPARAVAWLVKALEDVDDSLERGELVLSGSLTPAVNVAPGDSVTVEFGSLGTTTFHVD